MNNLFFLCSTVVSFYKDIQSIISEEVWNKTKLVNWSAYFCYPLLTAIQQYRQSFWLLLWRWNRLMWYLNAPTDERAENRSLLILRIQHYFPWKWAFAPFAPPLPFQYYEIIKWDGGKSFIILIILLSKFWIVCKITSIYIVGWQIHSAEK